jgi:putative glycosyltransferase
VRLSIVTTLYRSAGTIHEFYQRTMAAAEPLGYDIEMIMVNDGSPDASLDLAIALQKADPRVTIIDLSRNFGHHKAVMTGLAYATGDLVFLIDSDLEEEPEELPRFHARFLEGDCDVIYGVQEKRRGDWFTRWSGNLFFALANLLSDQRVPRNWTMACLMSHNYVRALVRHRDREFLFGHLMELAGFRQVAFPIRKLSRSPTTYSLRMRIEIAIKFLTTTSTRLLYLVLYVGLAIFGLSTVVILFYIGRYLTVGIGVDGFTSLIVSIWFFGGLTTLILGVQGIYVANILSESKRRPYTIVRKVYRVERRTAASTNVMLGSLPGTRTEATRIR